MFVGKIHKMSLAEVCRWVTTPYVSIKKFFVYDYDDWCYSFSTIWTDMAKRPHCAESHLEKWNLFLLEPTQTQLMPNLKYRHRHKPIKMMITIICQIFDWMSELWTGAHGGWDFENFMWLYASMNQSSVWTEVLAR